MHPIFRMKQEYKGQQNISPCKPINLANFFSLDCTLEDIYKFMRPATELIKLQIFSRDRTEVQNFTSTSLNKAQVYIKMSKETSSPIQFHDKENYCAEMASFLPRNMVHKYIMVDLSLRAPLHIFHASHFCCGQPSWHFDTHPPRFHDFGHLYLLTVRCLEENKNSITKSKRAKRMTV